MKTIEQELKDLILSEYKSIREFAIEIDMPYSTLDSIFKRGVSNASITNIIKICNKLDISVDMLASGKIQKNNANKTTKNPPANSADGQLLELFKLLSDDNKEKITELLRMYIANQED